MRYVCSLIDESGRNIQGLPRSARRFLRIMTEAQFYDYAVRNLGHVALARSASSIIVRMRPSIVQPKAYVALMYYLADLGPRRVMLQHFQDRWQNELFGRVDAAIAAITRLVQPQMTPGNSIANRDLAISDLESGSALRPLVQEWSVRPRWRQVAHLLDTVKTCTDGRFVLFERDTAQGAFRYRDVGPGIPEWGQRFFLSGLRLQDGPDLRFSQFCTVTFNRAFAAFQPKLDEVDAIITWPSFGPLRRRYRRLILPVRDPADREWLVSATLVDGSISLLPKAG